MYHLQDEVHEVLEGGFAGERIVQHLLEHSKRVDVVQHRLGGQFVARVSVVRLNALSSSLLGIISLAGSVMFQSVPKQCQQISWGVLHK